MKSQALTMNVIAALLLFVAILVHIVCMATPHMAGVDFSTAKDAIQQILGRLPGGARAARHREIMRQMLSTEIYYGPWKFCSENSVYGMEGCDDYEDPAEWIKATQAFSLLGVLAAIGALAVCAISIFFLCKGNWKSMLPMLSCILACGAGACIIIEAIIFAAKHGSGVGGAEVLAQQSSQFAEIVEDASYLDWGFGLDIVAAILLFVAGVIQVLSGRPARREGSV